MKRIATPFLLVLVIISSFFLVSCTIDAQNKKEKEFSDYLKTKYNITYTVTSNYASKGMNEPCSRMYFTNDNLNKHIAFVQKKLINGKSQICDNYLVACQYDSIVAKLSEYIKQVYPNCEIRLNFYTAYCYVIPETTLTTDNILSCDKYGVRASVYLKSDDDLKTQSEKLKSINKIFADNNCHINSVYYGFINKKGNIKDIDKYDTTYDLAIDSMSRKKEFKGKMSSEFFSYHQKNTGKYDLVFKQ